MDVAKVQMEIDIAIDEIFGNIACVLYAKNRRGNCTERNKGNFPERLELTFIDKAFLIIH